MKFAVLLLTGGVLVAAAASPVSKDLAEAFHKKLLVIAHHSTTRAERPRETTLTEDEANSYLWFKSNDLLPVGVTEPSIRIHGEGRVSGRAVVNLDAVRQKKSSGGWLDPTSFLMGKLPVTASGVLRTQDGTGQFELETAEISGIPIPKALLQEIVAYYTRSADHPRGVSLDAPFELPANIRRVDSQPGRAVVVQ